MSPVQSTPEGRDMFTRAVEQAIAPEGLLLPLPMGDAARDRGAGNSDASCTLPTGTYVPLPSRPRTVSWNPPTTRDTQS